MSKARPRPWINATPMLGFMPEWAGQFDTFNDWVNHATRALSGVKGDFGQDVTAFCVDAKGRRCNIGGDFMRARDEDAFPVRYFFTGSVLEDVSDAGRRQWFISWLVENQGYFRRMDIMVEFCCSRAQASLDIKRWISKHPGKIHHNTKRKCYERCEASHG